MLLPIKIYDDPVLREKAKPVEIFNEDLARLGNDMAETMYDARGIGLAANQVGLTDRIIVVDVDWSDRRGRRGSGLRSPTLMINPEVLEEGTEDDVYSEGCLSLPELEGDVWRAAWIRYRYHDPQGQLHEDEAEGLRARCILHEIDHLDGILFIDRMAPELRLQLAGQLARLRQWRLQIGRAHV